jgi:RimJ/RimL family protein N-acetyltransferase
MTDKSGFPRNETLKGGLAVTIRLLRADDRQKIASAVGRLARDSIYFRLFSYRKELTERGLDRIMAIDAEREVVLVVTQGDGDAESVIGSGRMVESDAMGADRPAEVAFMVDKAHQGKGIAHRVLQHLVAIARDRHITALEADVLSKNKAMLAVFAKSGLPMSKRRDGGVVHVSLSLRGESP